jgi:hypothetical protein
LFSKELAILCLLVIYVSTKSRRYRHEMTIPYNITASRELSCEDISLALHTIPSIREIPPATPIGD